MCIVAVLLLTLIKVNYSLSVRVIGKSIYWLETQFDEVRDYFSFDHVIDVD